MKFVFDCDGKYEAEKLTALISVQKDGTVYIAGVSAVIGNEVVIKLKDKSSHAVVMKDRRNAERLEVLLKNIADNKANVLSSNSTGQVAEIAIAD